jgi:hypothetical protein
MRASLAFTSYVSNRGFYDIAPRPAPQLQAVMQQLQWGSAWLTLFLQRQQQNLQTTSQG